MCCQESTPQQLVMNVQKIILLNALTHTQISHLWYPLHWRIWCDIVCSAGMVLEAQQFSSVF